MTAEIALLNKSAVVLAADSAVTIVMGGPAKIFNTVNKIFSFNDVCPSLVHIEIDGIIQKKIKLVRKEDVDIGRHGPSAEVLGFAQDDVVQSFINGFNPAYRAYSSKILRSAIEEAAKLAIRPTSRNDDKIIKLLNGLSDEFNQLSNQFVDSSDQFIDSDFTQDVKSMVKSMPKQELANLAEITSLK